MKAIGCLFWIALAVGLVMTIDIHISNILIWMGGCVLTALVLPQDFKEELGGVVMIVILLFWSLFCVITFGICGVEGLDWIRALDIKISW